MQELDALKSQSAKVSEKSREAIAFLHKCFASGHPRVKGQTMEEVNLLRHLTVLSDLIVSWFGLGSNRASQYSH